MAFAALSVLLVALGVAHASEDCTDIDFFLSISAQEVSCATLKSAGQCGCYVYGGEDGTSNWVNPSTGGWIDGCAPSAAGFTDLPSLDGVTLTEEQGNMLVSDFCPGTCLISSGERCAIDNPYEGLDTDAQLVSLFGGNPLAVCSTCAVPGQMCIADFCTTTAAILCPATCYQNDLSGFTDSGMLAAYDSIDLTVDNDWVLEPFFGYSCDDIDTLGGPGGGLLCVPEEFGSRTSQWALFCPVTCAEKFPKMYAPFECEADDTDYADSADTDCAGWVVACADDFGEADYYPFLHAVTDEICADLYDPSAAWRSSAFLNASGTAASLLAGFDAQLAEWSCEAGALVWYSTSSQKITLYSKAWIDEVRASCGTSCSSACVDTSSVSSEASCVVCDARQRRNRRLLFGSLPCCA